MIFVLILNLTIVLTVSVMMDAWMWIDVVLTYNTGCSAMGNTVGDTDTGGC